MLGLAIMFIGFIYLIILCFATIKAYCTARRNKLSRKAAALWGLVGFLVVFLPVFWDWIPTVKMHNYYCKNEAGLFQYKTIEQWKAENPGVWETAKPYSREESQNANLQDGVLNGIKYKRSLYTNRIAIYGLTEQIHLLNILKLQLRKIEYLLVDEKTKEVIAKSVEFYTGPGNTLELGNNKGWAGLKIWLNSPVCGGGDFFKIKREFINQSLKQKGIKYD